MDARVGEGVSPTLDAITIMTKLSCEVERKEGEKATQNQWPLCAGGGIALVRPLLIFFDCDSPFHIRW
jgi:hypothetical protein